MPFDHFGPIAGIYDRMAGFTISGKFLDYLQPSIEGSLLDIGGGTGKVAAAFQKLFTRIVIADPSIGMLRRAAAKGLSAVCTPAEQTPFLGGSFDRIIMRDAFHHVVDQEKVAEELWRIIPSGGRIIIIEPDIQRFSVKLIAVMEKLLLMRSHFRSSEEIIRYFIHPDAKVNVVRDEINIWVVIERVR